MTDLSPRTKGTIFHQVVINVHVVNWAHTSATMIFLPEDAGCSSEIHVPTDSFLNSEHQQWPVPFSTKTLPYKRQVMDRNETLLHYSCNISLTSLKPPYIYTLRCSPNIMKPHRAFNITHHMSLYKIYQAPSNNTKIHPTLPRTNVSGIPKNPHRKSPVDHRFLPAPCCPKRNLGLGQCLKANFIQRWGGFLWESFVKMGRDLKFRDLWDFEPNFLSHKYYLDQTFDFQKSSESLRENEGKPPWF